MHDLILKTQEQAKELIVNAVKSAQKEGRFPEAEIPAFTVEIPADTTHADFAANIAMAGAKAFRMPPAKIAAVIADRLEFDGTFFVRAQVAGPGFLNLFVSREWFSGALLLIDELGARYGRTNIGSGKKVMVEFVSANPTGPMHMGNARGGVIGDCLASVLEATGHEVEREFYLNDAGNQIEKFGMSLEARYLQKYLGEEAAPFPEDGYQGGDITDLAELFAEKHADSYLNKPDCREALVAFALPHNVNAMKETLRQYRIEYDTWFHESKLHGDGAVDRAMQALRDRDMVYEKDGAVWYAATKMGEEKDEVLIRQNGNPTYFAADIAYHYNKFHTRGFGRVINIWGADHHGHVARMKGAMDAVGLDGGNLDIVLMQLVRLMKNGEPYRMSKRSGRSVTLSDLLELVSADAARFFFNMREAGSAMDFDLDLAVREDSQNPVYYVQYAHARICSLEKKLKAENISYANITREEYNLLEAPEETGLIRLLAQLPGVIAGAAARYDTASLTRCAIDVATLFHKFYTNCHVMVDDQSLCRARAGLCMATRTVIANLLNLMKVSAPETM
jgi:arginyl-tRNA synthetase